MAENIRNKFKKILKKELFSGFTLIEMIGVIIVLSIIALIVYPTIGKIITTNKTKAYEKQIEVIEDAASNWLIENEGKLRDNAYALPINDIVSSGFVEENELINPINNEPLTGCVFITWRKNIKQYEYNYFEDCNDFVIPSLVSLTASSNENKYGWRNKDFYISLNGSDIENYYYCIGDKKCEPNIIVNNINESIAFNEEGIKYVCAYGMNKSGETESVCERYRLDKTKPVIGTIVFDGTIGLDKWFVSNVTVKVTDSTDALSGIDTDVLSPSETSITKDTKGTTYTLTAKDKAENVNTVSYSIKLDKTKPTVGTLVINGTKGENGWYNSDLAFNITDGSDKTSGHKSTTSSVSKITSDTTGTKIIITTTDNAGNISTSEQIVKMDKTAPSAPTNMNFVFADWSVYTNNTWTNKNVYAASSKTNYGPSGSADSVSNVWKYQISTDNVNWVDYNYTASGIYLMDAEQVHTRYFRALDYAGNASNSISRTAKVDKTKPTVGELVINGTLGSNSWYTSDLTFGVKNGTDTLSGHASTTSSISSITYNTIGTNVVVTTKDNAGNTETKTYTVKVDKTAPTFTVRTTNAEIVEQTNITTLTYFNSPTYSISGGSISCNPVNTASLDVGTRTLTCTAVGGNGLKTQAHTTVLVESLPNPPVLYANMVPIKYENNKWVVADTSQKWYDYYNKQWANAVILNRGTTKSVGQEVTEENVALWYVWIPRYKYTIFNGQSGVSSNEQVIKVSFEKNTNRTGTVTCVDDFSVSERSEVCTDSTYGSVTNFKSTYTHPAFKFGSTELTGFWFGKFELSGSASYVKMVPNASSYTGANMGTYFNAVKRVESTYGITNADSHVIKNMEWGAVAYLKQSKFGQGATEVTINTKVYTGGGTDDAYKTNVSQSTTGNIYGVYDMNGGYWDNAMGIVLNSSNTFSSRRTGLSSSLDPKYYDKYKYGSSTVQARGKLGDATRETMKTYGTTRGGWYSDFADFPYGTSSIMITRGGRYANGANAGEFALDYMTGAGGYNNTTRGSITAK